MDATASDDWKRYGRAVIRSMREVLTGANESTDALLLETADYWLSIGLMIGLQDPVAAGRLLALVEPNDEERLTLQEDAYAFRAEVVE